MKKLIAILVLALTFASSDVMAQKRGDVYFGGDFGIGIDHASASMKDYGNIGAATTVDFEIMPKIGIFVADRLMFGVGLGYGIEGGEGSTSHTLVLGPTLSYYAPIAKNLYYTPALDLAFCYVATDGEGLPGFGLGLTLVGMEYRPTQKIGISGSLLSLNYVLLSKEGVNVNTFDFGLSINPTIGFKVYF